MQKTFHRIIHRRLLIAPLVALMAVVIWLGYRSTDHAGAATVDHTVTVSTGTISETVAASGTVEPAQSADLSFSASGQVTAVDVKAGQSVTAGAALATVDPATGQTAVAQDQSTVAQDQDKVSSDTTSDASAVQMTADQANLAAADAALASAEETLAGATLTSPIDGTVSVVNLTVGQQVGSAEGGNGGGAGSSANGASATEGSSGGAATDASTTSTPEVEVVSAGFVVNLSVDDTQIAKLKVGQTAAISTSTGSNGSTGAAGTVTSVGEVATATDGVASFPVTVAVSGAPTGLFSGDTVEVAITYQELSNVLEVPSAAVTQSGGAATVSALVNGSRMTKRVTTGVTSGGETQIVSGLQAGDQVIVATSAASATAGSARRDSSGSGVLGGASELGGGSSLGGGGSGGGASGGGVGGGYAVGGLASVEGVTTGRARGGRRRGTTPRSQESCAVGVVPPGRLESLPR